MSESDDSDILADIRALDDALMLDVNDKADKSWNVSHDDSSLSINDDSDDSNSEDELYIKSCQGVDIMNAYEINKKLIKSLTVVKKKVTALLQRCEEKIEELNEELDTTKDGKIIERLKLSIAGMPYFKDKSGFTASKNLDTKAKEARGELSVLHVQKPCRWSDKDRGTLLSAVCDEIFNAGSISDFGLEIEQQSSRRTNVSNNQNSKNPEIISEGPSSSNTVDKSVKRTIIPRNFSEVIKTMGEKEFDWMKIAAHDFENKHSSGECRSMWNVCLHPDINKADWTTKEDQALLQHVKACNYQDWDTIATKLNSKRSAYQCFIRYNTIQDLPTGVRIWSKSEDKHLERVISTLQVGNYIPWAEVATYLNKRTKQQVYTRWIYRKAPHLTKGRFKANETQTLLEAVIKYGTDFSKISRYVMPHRTTVQLSGHYQTILQNKENNWTYEDDIKLLKLHKKYGNDWVEVAKRFDSKTRTQVRLRYTALLRYIKRGCRITNIPRNVRTSVSQRRINIPLLLQLSSSSSTLSNNPKRKTLSFTISNHTVNARLFENLSFPLMTGKSNSQKIHNIEELEHRTKELNNALKLLNVNFDIPTNFLDYAHLNRRQRQLFTSLKTRMQAYYDINNKEHNEMIEKFRRRMFTSETEDDSHFIPPLPFNGYVKKRKTFKADSTNYNLDLSNKFLVDDVCTDTITPCNINSSFISVDEDIQFHKLSQFLSNNNYNKPNVNSSECRSSLSEKRTRTLRSKPNTEAKVESCNSKEVQTCKIQNTIHTEYINEHYEEEDAARNIVPPCRETLLSLKNLFLWKMLYEYENQSCTNNDIEELNKAKSPEYKKAYLTLKTRLMRLFKLPIAVSNVMINLPEEEPIFLLEDSEGKRTNKKSQKRKKKQK